MEFGQKQRADREAGQSSLFGGAAPGAEPESVQPLPDLPDWSEKTRLSHEKATLGFYVSGHPLESYRDLLHDFATHSSGVLGEISSGTEVAIGGMIGDLRRRKSRKGDWWASLSLEDLDGHLEVLVFPKCYKSCQDELENDRPAMIVGRLEVDEDRIRLIADDVHPLEELRQRQVESVRVELAAGDLDDDLVQRLRSAVERHRGSTPLYLEVARPGAYRMVARVETALRVSPSRQFSEALESVVGPNRVHYKAKGLLEGRR
jgi:DNA polymerase-3 subunit alpha